MKRIVVLMVSPVGDYIRIGFFRAEGGESTQTLTLPKSLFPEDIKQGDELVFAKMPSMIFISLPASKNK